MFPFMLYCSSYSRLMDTIRIPGRAQLTQYNVGGCQSCVILNFDMKHRYPWQIEKRTIDRKSKYFIFHMDESLKIDYIQISLETENQSTPKILNHRKSKSHLSILGISIYVFFLLSIFRFLKYLLIDRCIENHIALIFTGKTGESEYRRRQLAVPRFLESHEANSGLKPTIDVLLFSFPISFIPWN